MLDGVQKFNYLRAQLQGDAASVIAGLPLTTVNYSNAMALLAERFGQPTLYFLSVESNELDGK